jgi:nitrite reductase/ring-hydroxylating ferredoxin subunit
VACRDGKTSSVDRASARLWLTRAGFVELHDGRAINRVTEEGIVMGHQVARFLDRHQEPEPFHQCWYPVALAAEITGAKPTGIELLGTKVLAYRDAANQAIVQEAWCPHLGADLSLGECIGGTIRCPYHHWRFDAQGHCVEIPAGDKIPPGARVHTFPTAEAWGLVWAFNGETPLYDVPGIPGVEESDLFYSTHARGIRKAPPWLAVSNGVDFQHLRALHNLQTGEPDQIDVGDHGIEYCIDTASYRQHGRIQGTNVFAQHLRSGGSHQFMLFAGAPIDTASSRGFFIVGVKPSESGVGGEQATKARLEGLRSFVQRLIAEDDPVLNTINFRRGVMTASDRHLSRYFKYVNEFPLAPARP